jgi:hypothetical protein
MTMSYFVLTSSVTKTMYTKILSGEPGSSFSTVSDYRLDDLGLIPERGREFFPKPLPPDRLWGPPNLLYKWIREVLSQGGKRGRGVMLTTHTLLVPSLRKSTSYINIVP